MKHIQYGQVWLTKMTELIARSNEQIDRLERASGQLSPWQKESHESMYALNTYAMTFQDNREHEIHMKARLAAQKHKMQIERTENLKEKYAAWQEILETKKQAYIHDQLDSRNILERNSLARLIIRHRVQQISSTRPRHSEAMYDACIIDTVTLVAKRNHLDL